jgi:ribosome-binding factor A
MSVRNERLKEVIREESAEVILQHLTDPRIGFCTVTRVELTNDMSYCTIHVSVFGDEAAKSRTMHGLQDARGLLQKRIAKRLKTRTTPHVTIELDESIEKSFSVISKIREARASDPDAGKSTAEVPVEDSDDEDDE